MNFLKQFWALCKNELFYTFIKDGRRAILIIFASTAYLLLFGLLYNQGVINHVPTAVLDQNNTPISRALVEDIDSSNRFDVQYYAMNQEDLLNYLNHNRDSVAFQIPAHFDRDIKLGRGSNILFTINGSNLVLTSVSSIGVIEIVKDFSDRISQGLLERELGMLPQKAYHLSQGLQVNYRIIGNSTLSYLTFFVLGLGLAAFQQGIFLCVAAAFLFRKQKILDVERSMHPLWRLFAKVFTYWVESFIALSILLWVGAHVLALPYAANSYVPLFALAGAFSLLLCAIGSFVASFRISELTFTRISVFYTVPAFILSGFTWPLGGMPPAMQALAACSPMTYVANAFRMYYLNGYSPVIWQNALYLALWSIPFFIAAAYLYNKKVISHFEKVDTTKALENK